MKAIILLKVALVNAFSSNLEQIAESFFGAAESFGSNYIATSGSRARTKQVKQVLSDELRLKGVLETLGNRVSELQTKLETVDQRLYEKAEDIELHVAEMKAEAAERLMQVTKLYRLYHDHLMPEKANEPLIIVELSDDVMTLSRAIDKYFTHLRSHQAGIKNECTQWATAIQQYQSLSRKSDLSSLDLISEVLKDQPTEDKLEAAMINAAYYRGLGTVYTSRVAQLKKQKETQQKEANAKQKLSDLQAMAASQNQTSVT